jgi:NAD(P)-dependent dehydrogenase (short-subunit alcohol dehydrogenase family)
MDLKLQGKLAVVTGSTGAGIGKEIALEFARRGAIVVVNGSKISIVDSAVDDIAKELKIASKNRVVGLSGDVGSETGVNAFIKQLEAVEEQIGKKVHVLVNNVGIFHSQDFVDVTDEKWMHYYQI